MINHISAFFLQEKVMTTGGGVSGRGRAIGLEQEKGLGGGFYSEIYHVWTDRCWSVSGALGTKIACVWLPGLLHFAEGPVNSQVFQ